MGFDVLVFGATGQVASALARARWSEGARVTFLDRAAADLATPRRLGAIVRERRPDAVVIAAAYTDVDRAEREEPLAMRVNAEGPAAIAAAAAALGAPVIHLSSDYVFDGQKPQPYVETDAAAPISAYGRSKLAGEAGVRAANARHLILRTAWVYGPRGRGFLGAMLRLAAAGEAASVVDDQIGCPTSAADLAQAIADLAPRLRDPDAPFGAYHLAGTSARTWFDFAEDIMQILADRGLPRPRIRAVPSSAYPSLARRPHNSRLCCRSIESAFGIRLPGCEDSLAAVVTEALKTQ